jgi:hypothetical protein
MSTSSNTSATINTLTGRFIVRRLGEPSGSLDLPLLLLRHERKQVSNIGCNYITVRVNRHDTNTRRHVWLQPPRTVVISEPQPIFD